MMPTGRRTRAHAILIAQLLAFVVLAVSPRALLTPTEIVHKSKESKRPKAPKNVVRAEPIRIPGAEKQGQGPKLPRLDAGTQDVDASLQSARVPELPRKAFTQITKPDYLKFFSSGIPPTSLAPPV